MNDLLYYGPCQVLMFSAGTNHCCFWGTWESPDAHTLNFSCQWASRENGAFPIFSHAELDVAAQFSLPKKGLDILWSGSVGNTLPWVTNKAGTLLSHRKYFWFRVLLSLENRVINTTTVITCAAWHLTWYVCSCAPSLSCWPRSDSQRSSSGATHTGPDMISALLCLTERRIDFLV